ncbi:MAG: hypothetical protein AVDCRST_MAG37-1304 [uncultured Rubrobacteraceae bacterium]|uniref:Uncharacterized protein n=1 Tax=uncultured Rubrobacteraceae bacterium TaxID=349277 RepID=A0A6J4QKU9_9ACTN|nr:MAG: hypothetical protein AVDCRST_MAG37-1304 [uncultured Rubrobacteraceae bacterium]
MVVPGMVSPVPRRRMRRSLPGVLRAVRRIGELVNDAEQAVAQQERHQ